MSSPPPATVDAVSSKDGNVTSVSKEPAQDVQQDNKSETTLEENVKIAVTVISECGESTGTQVFEGDTNPYKCKNCHKVFRNNGALHTHMKKYEERARCELKYECKDCGRFFKNNGALHTHLKVHIKKTKGKKSPANYAKAVITNKGSSSVVGVKAVSSNGDGNSVDISKVVGSNGNGMDGTKKGGDGEGGGDCSQGGDSDAELVDQSGVKGGESSVVECPVCAVLVSDKTALETHMESHQSGSDVNGVSSQRGQGDGRSMRRQGKFQCETCGREFGSRGGMLIHEQIHDGEKRLHQCPSCDKAYLNKGGLEKHMKTHRPGAALCAPGDDQSHRCVVCNQRFKVKGYLGKHIKRCHPGHSVKINNNLLIAETVAQSKPGASKCTKVTFYPCKICGKNFHYQSLLSRHMQSHSKDAGRTLMAKGQSLDHNKVCQPDSKEEDSSCELTCTDCSEKFSNETDFRNHCLIHVPKNPYKCTQCGKSFKHQEPFSRHVLFHQHSSGTKSHQCNLCPKRFSKSYTLKYHIASHSQAGVFKCHVCKKVFRTKSSFQLHVDTHKTKPYKCEVCGWSLRHKASFVRHKLMHQERCFKCSVCATAFVKHLDLMKHLKSHETDTDAQRGQSESVEVETIVKPINTPVSTSTSKLSTVCAFCSKEFVNRKTLRNHMRVHRKETFKCDFCDKSFNRLYTLRSHLKIIHKKVLCNTKQGWEGELVRLNFSNQVLFKCPVCGFVFIHRRELVGHMRIHSGQKPYECSTCRATFNGRFQLQEHVTSQHPEIFRHKKTDARHVCVICSKAFIRRCDLVRHLKVHQKHGHSIPASLLN